MWSLLALIGDLPCFGHSYGHRQRLAAAAIVNPVNRRGAKLVEADTDPDVC
jgi:hypothetical protein